MVALSEHMVSAEFVHVVHRFHTRRSPTSERIAESVRERDYKIKWYGIGLNTYLDGVDGCSRRPMA